MGIWLDVVVFTLVNFIIWLLLETLFRWRCILTAWSRALLKKLIGFQLVKKFPAFNGTWRFITTFPSAVWIFCNKIRFDGEELLAPRLTPKLEVQPLSAVHDYLFSIFNYPAHWRPFLQPQPEDAPCCGDRDPLIKEWGCICLLNFPIPDRPAVNFPII